MDKFVVEVFVDGELLNDEIVETNQRLLNEQDLDAVTANKVGVRKLLFIRNNTDVNNGYFVEADGRWDYGTREYALNIIKTRLAIK